MALQVLLVLAAISLAHGQLGMLEGEVQEYIPISDAQLQDLEFQQNPELLPLAATNERIFVEITSAQSASIVREGMNVNMDCLPWLNSFPDRGGSGSIRWLKLQRDENGIAVDPEPQRVDPTPFDEIETSSTVVGGELNRWYNITSAIIVSGAEDTSIGDYICNVCFSRGTPSEECHNATMQLHILGAPPMLVRSDVPTDGPGDTLVYDIGANFCINPPPAQERIFIQCSILEGEGIPQVVPAATRTWVKDGVVMFSGESSGPFNDAFLMSGNNSLFMPGLITPSPLNIMLLSATGGISINTEFFNISVPSMLPPGVTEVNYEEATFQALLGDYMCSVNNVYGGDSAKTTISNCATSDAQEDAPVLCYASDTCSGAGVQTTQETCCNNLVEPVGFSFTTAETCQRCPVGSSQTQCFTSVNCNAGSSLSDISITDAESCCLAETSLAFNAGSGCTVCNVVGWSTVAKTIPENGVQQQAMVSVVKGAIPTVVILTFMLGTDNTAGPNDFVPPSVPGPFPIIASLSQTFFFAANGDSISQEGDETFTLLLQPVGSLPNGVFLRSTLVVTIPDETRVSLEWTEDDYVGTELSQISTGQIFTTNTIANPIMLRVTPVTYSEVSSMFPGSGITAPEGAPFEADTTDFDDSVIFVTLQPGVRVTDVIFPIIDDPILEEAEEGFLAIISLESAMFPDLIDIDASSRRTLIRIRDNDVQTRVGFQQSSYTVREASGLLEVCVEVFTRQLVSDISLIVESETSTAGNSDFTDVGQHPVFFTALGPRIQCFDVVITDDNLAEGTETFSLILKQDPSLGSSGILIEPNVAEITILDDNSDTCPGGFLFFELNGVTYEPNSIIVISELGTSTTSSSVTDPGSSLVCMTEDVNTECCRNRDGGNIGEWVYPDGSMVPRNSNSQGLDFSRSGFTHQIRLNRLTDSLGPVGTYMCVVPPQAGCGNEMHVASVQLVLPVPGEMLSLCPITVWGPPRGPFGDYTGYDLRYFIPDGNEMVINKRGNEFFQLVTDEVRSLGPLEDMFVQVRARAGSHVGPYTRAAVVCPMDFVPN